ncbi:fasciclin domain-containing protein [Chromohalobacter israelensis]|uniref:fasciclin domain-containing protein n=1 Tax=Chromohalobacter israelensis TaxID=141390 RepID=UPI0013E8E36F|nr:fasciclin domain-containing protein [Chromohalobacter salexigens]
MQANVKKDDLIGALRESGHFDTYLSELEKADLTGKLSGAGPFTLFAPTDGAFARMPEEKRSVLFEPEHAAELKNLLRYHVVPGRIPAEEVGMAGHVQALTQQVDIRRYDGQLMVNAARVVVPATQVSNGVLYGIDEVLIPHFQNLFLPDPTDRP